ncbi:helix-turn-helix transcriptional regulator [Novosphingobium sp. JCM 18896]|uniref:helix-turn-helix transcriptional regulator n=1 Tax=Novosphingobium sp. JCM 18896 TaxID=2989731 RepID=UPI002223A199|nr:LuxR C-terminal-related transcriptional regulator [Novosphingobium sp. JCM 18896]MCW1430170.1 LuxR C-terminal-related transcriptional regulator [Novosphingobium sp. JCM 18896]
MHADTIADIYEAGAFPDRWLTVLENIAKIVGAQGGNFILNNGTGISVISSPSVFEVSRDFDREGWNRDNSRVRRLLARADYPGFLTDSDTHSAEEMRQMPMYTEFLIPRGADAGAATIVQGAQDDVVAIAFEAFGSHAASRAAVPLLDSYRPHLARAAALSSQVAQARATTLSEVFSALGASVAVLDAQGRVLSATPLFADAFDDLLQDSKHRLRIVEPRSDERLALALAEMRTVRQGVSIPVRGQGGEGRAILHLVPALRDARDLFSNIWTIAVLAKPGNRLLPTSDIIAALFDLTPTEARVARSIAHGTRPKEVARAANVSVETVRSQLKRIFQKTQTEHQSALAILLKDLS